MLPSLVEVEHGNTHKGFQNTLHLSPKCPVSQHDADVQILRPAGCCTLLVTSLLSSSVVHDVNRFTLIQQILDSNSQLLLVKEEHFTSLAHTSIAVHLVIQWWGPSAKDDKVQLLYCSRYILCLSSFVLSLLPPAVFSVPSLSSSALSLPP